MKPSNQFKLATFSLTVLVLMSGCQSGAFPKPDLGRLAFWKQDELSLASKRDDIPPPSHHFSPDNGFADQGSASKEKAGGSELKASIDEIIAEAKRTQQAKADAAADATAGAVDKVTNAISGAVSKPYSLDKIDPKLSLNHSESTAKALQQFGSATKNTLAASTESIGGKTTDAVKNTANALGDLKNSFQASAGSSLKNASEQLKNQTGNVIGKTASTLNNIAEKSQTTFGQTIEDVRTNVDNSFKPVATKVVANPFAASNNKSESSLLPASSNPGSNDFAARFNQALADTESAIAKSTAPSGSPTPTKKAGQTINQFVSQPSRTISTPDFAEGSGVRQSSFDGSVSKTTAAILQPVATQPVATKTTTPIQPFQSTASQPLRAPATTQTQPQSTPSTSTQAPTRTASSASQYPTTSYGVIKPMKNSTEEATSSSDDSFQVPQHLLRGEGSFSPGSTRPLRPVQER